MSNQYMRRFCIFPLGLVLCAFLISCTATLNNESEYNQYLSKQLTLHDSEDVKWHLWQLAGLTRIRNHSEGYVLTVVRPENLSSVSYFSKEENAQHIGSANLSRIKITDFYEFGMEDPSVRAKAWITLKDGREFPCEIVWFRFTPNHLRPN